MTSDPSQARRSLGNPAAKLKLLVLSVLALSPTLVAGDPAPRAVDAKLLVPDTTLNDVYGPGPVLGGGSPVAAKEGEHTFVGTPPGWRALTRADDCWDTHSRCDIYSTMARTGTFKRAGQTVFMLTRAIATPKCCGASTFSPTALSPPKRRASSPRGRATK